MRTVVNTASLIVYRSLYLLTLFLSAVFPAVQSDYMKPKHDELLEFQPSNLSTTHGSISQSQTLTRWSLDMSKQ